MLRRNLCCCPLHILNSHLGSRGCPGHVSMHEETGAHRPSPPNHSHSQEAEGSMCMGREGGFRGGCMGTLDHGAVVLASIAEECVTVNNRSLLSHSLMGPHSLAQTAETPHADPLFHLFQLP